VPSGWSGGTCAVVLNIVHVAYVLSSVKSFSASAVHREVSLAGCPLFAPFSLSNDISVTGACFLAWGLMAALRGCASHGGVVQSGTGCQKWKLLDLPGTQPPLVMQLLFPI